MLGWILGKKKPSMGNTSSVSTSSMPGISSDDYFAEKDNQKPKSKSWFSREEEPKSRALLEPGEEEVDLKIDGKSKGFNAALFGRTLQKGFAQLYNDKLLSDVILVLTEKRSGEGEKVDDNDDESEESDAGEDGGKAKGKDSKDKKKVKDEDRVYAHRMVLATWSDIFRGMLSHEWKESQSNEIVVELEPGEKEHFKCMLKYMYTGAVDFINHTNVIPLLRLCDYYGVSGLKEVCGELLGTHVNEDTIFFFLEIMDQFDCGALNEKCGEFLAQNFDAMLKDDRERMMRLRTETWVVMLKEDSLKIRSEETLFEAVLEFAAQFEGNGKGSKEKVLERLLPHIRYPLMSPKYLVENVEDNKELLAVNGLREILYETFRLKSYPNAKPKHVCATPRKGSQGFDSTRCGSGISISDNDQKMVMTSGGWNSVYCKVPFSAARNYIEFKLETGNTHMIGVANGTVPTNGQYAGQSSNGWTYYTASGYLYTSGGQQSAYGGGQCLYPGDILGIKVDVNAGTLQCFKNGSSLFTYTGLPTNSATIYPIVGTSGTGTVSIVDGPYHK